MKKFFPLHPFLFSLYPALFIFSHNKESVILQDVYSSMALAAGTTLAALVVLTLKLRSVQKAGILVTTFLILFFSFGQVFQVTEKWIIGNFYLGRPIYISVLWIVTFLIVAFYVLRAKNVEKPTRYLNLAGGFLIGLNLLNLSLYAARTPASLDESPANWHLQFERQDEKLTRSENPPDIYYIVLDQYARSDVMKELYGYDNREFLDYLRNKGFYVASKSRSNYALTVLSLSSSLNMSLLGDEEGRANLETIDRRAVTHLIRHSIVREYFEKLGYTWVAFSSGLTETEMRDADLYLASGMGVSEFHHLLLNTTPLPWLWSWVERLDFKSGFKYSQYQAQRNEILFTLDRLPDIAGIEEPTFTFVHLMAPRHPFVFGPNGEAREPERPLFSFLTGEPGKYEIARWRERYRDQTIFITKRIKEVVDSILVKSPEPPVIILQSDTGPIYLEDLSTALGSPLGLKESLSILNAYYFPDGPPELYEGITPVNTFRLVFNHYFGTDFKFAEDKSFLASRLEKSPFPSGRWLWRFSDVTEKVKGPRFARPSARGLSPRADTAPDPRAEPVASSAVKSG